MNKILIITGRYLPGFKDGGPVRSILNLTEWFGDRLDIRILCHDRDHGDDKPYPGITYGEYNQVGAAKVFYVESYSKQVMRSLSSEVDLVYVCGPYDDYAIMAMWLKRTGQIKVPMVIAAMGSFSPEAFNIKGGKKAAFIKIMKALGMFKNISWSVTSKREEDELKQIIGGKASCIIASDLARKNQKQHLKSKEEKSLDICFVSRIARKKNLIAIPEILELVNEDINITIDIYGFAEDEEYLKLCLEKFSHLPDRIKWEYKGGVDSETIPDIFASYDAFLFPTLGENFGHVIAESMDCGCVPVISDTTPWLDFNEKHCGYVCGINDKNDFARALDELAAKSSEEYAVISNNCREYMRLKKDKEAEKSGYKKIFGL